jgi:hypothetical protein
VVLIAVIVVGLVIFVPLIMYLCVKVGIKPTLGVFTIGLWPWKGRSRQQQGQPEGPVGEHHDDAPPNA